MAEPAYGVVIGLGVHVQLLTRTKLFYGVNYGHRAAKYDNLIHIMERSRGEGFGAEVKRRILLGMYERETDWHMRQPSF